MFTLKNMNAQTISSVSDSSIFSARVTEATIYSRADFRKNKRAFKQSKPRPATFRLFMNRTFAPKLSVDLLDGKGIHLFSITEMGPIPTMNVGARINAGIKITI